MRSQANVILLFALAAGPCSASFFQGTFAPDDQVAPFNITTNIAETVTFETYGYAGGTADSAVIPAGGFAPTAFLFDNMGGVQTLPNGSCSQVETDPVTGNCDDVYFQDLSLEPGTYTLALAVYGNSPVDTSVADGFVEDGEPGFTCQLAGNSGGSFCDLTTALGTSRTGDYAISITGADSVTQLGVPEPGSLFLLLTGGALASLLKRRDSSRR